MKIMFVCTGNTCRSPMAKALGEQLFTKEGLEVDVESAGLSVFFPSPASTQAVSVMANQGLSLDGHVSRQINEDMLNLSDLVLTMTKAHSVYLKDMFPNHSNKIFSLGEYAGDGSDIADPFAQPTEAYEICAINLKALIEKAALKLKAKS